MADRIDAIGQDSKAQSAEIEKLNQALSALDARTRDNAALVATNDTAAQALDRQATGLLQAAGAAIGATLARLVPARFQVNRVLGAAMVLAGLALIAT